MSNTQTEGEAKAKPSVFIGSSSEGLEFARAIRGLLSDVAQITLWNEGFFRPGNTFIDTLVNALPRFDFAALVLTADDLIRSRELESFSPRDNVLFELLVSPRQKQHRSSTTSRPGNNSRNDSYLNTATPSDPYSLHFRES